MGSSALLSGGTLKAQNFLFLNLKLKERGENSPLESKQNYNTGQENYIIQTNYYGY